MLTNATDTRVKTPAKTIPSTFYKIAKIIGQIIVKYNPPGQVKQALTEVLEMASKADAEEKGAQLQAPPNLVKSIQECMRADLLQMHNSLEAKITKVQANQEMFFASTESLSKSTESLQAVTKELESKVSKVNDTTDKLASTTMTYRDALMEKTTNPPGPDTDPRVISDMDRKVRQVLIAYNKDEENATLNVSLLELKDKANRTVTEIDDPTRPEMVRIKNVSRTCDGSLLLLLNSKEAADWLREIDVGDRFLDKFAIGACIRDRKYNVMLRWVPITLDPNSFKQYAEMEEVNTLSEGSICKMRWIKPINRRRAGQTRAHAILTLTTADTANRIIKDSLEICGVRVRAERVKQEPLQCLKCRGWEHKA